MLGWEACATTPGLLPPCWHQGSSCSPNLLQALVNLPLLILSLGSPKLQYITEVLICISLSVNTEHFIRLWTIYLYISSAKVFIIILCPLLLLTDWLVLGIEPRTSCMPDELSPTKLLSSPLCPIFSGIICLLVSCKIPHVFWCSSLTSYSFCEYFLPLSELQFYFLGLNKQRNLIFQSIYLFFFCGLWFGTYMLILVLKWVCLVLSIHV